MSSRPLVERALEIAESQIGIREVGRNRGPRVDEYIRSVGLDPARGSYPWCVAFVFWCFAKAAKEFAFVNPMPRTAGVHKLFRKSPAWAHARPAPGAIFCIDHGGGTGHVGFVSDVTGTHLVTIEGNTSPGGSREGDGVYKRTRRPEDITLGFLDFGRDPPEVA